MAPAVEDLRIDGIRLWDSLALMADIGPAPNGGSHRLTLSDDDRKARDLLTRWCKEAGCVVTVDSVGNMFARRPGADNSLPAVQVGSHLDTQPEGGRFDGVLGVLAAVEILRTMADHGVTTRHPIELVNWTNEEGARFAPGMLGSGVFTGVYSQSFAHALKDAAGKSFGGELARVGYLGPSGISPHPVRAYFELHIEQGPMLEAEGLDIGVVTHAQGIRWYDVTFTGYESHAGTTPMTGRRDALMGAARLVEGVQAIAFAHAPRGVGTVGNLSIRPGSRNVIPGSVTLQVDLRHPTTDGLHDMEFRLRTAATMIAAELGLTAGIQEVTRLAPVAFDEGAVAAVRNAAERIGMPYRDMVSGAGHDACNMAAFAPTAMVFCPCVGGISHNEAENILPEWAAVGTDVLMQAVLETAETAAG